MYLKGIDIIDKDGNKKYIKCKYLGVSGDGIPNIQISSHTGVKPVWNEKIHAFIPGKNNISSHLKATGSAKGVFGFNECILDAEKNVLEVLYDLKI